MYACSSSSVDGPSKIAGATGGADSLGGDWRGSWRTTLTLQSRAFELVAAGLRDQRDIPEALWRVERPAHVLPGVRLAKPDGRLRQAGHFGNVLLRQAEATAERGPLRCRSEHGDEFTSQCNFVD